jgi:hypothetical protein
MGAVTAIMYGDRDPSIAGMVLDSPFSSLKMLVEELVKDKVSLPNFIVNQALSLVKSTVQKKAKFKLEDIEPITYGQRCFIPALFVAAKNDNFVKPHHSQILHDSYPGDKNLIKIDGDHNSVRPRFFKDSAAIFFYNTLQVEFIKEVSDNYAGFIYTINKHEDEVDKDKDSDDRVKTVENDNNINFNNLNFNFLNGNVGNAEELRISSENNQIIINSNDMGEEVRVNFNQNENDKLNYYDIIENEEELFKKILEMSKLEYEKDQVNENNKDDKEKKDEKEIKEFKDEKEINININDNKVEIKIEEPKKEEVNEVKADEKIESNIDLIIIDPMQLEDTLNNENKINK